MLTEPQRDQLRQALRAMQIIVASLAFGVVSFFVVVLFIVPPAGGNRPANNLFLTYLGVGVAIVGLAVWFFLPNLIARQARKSVLAGDARRIVGNYQTQLIIGCALLEGFAFMNLVFYMIEHQPVSLVVAVVFLVILLAQIPTLNRLERWVESELTAIDQLRQLEPPRGR
jgi:hypothetical protein